jgi:hypothetical protein
MKEHVDRRMLKKDLQRLDSLPLPQIERERIATNLKGDPELQGLLAKNGVSYMEYNPALLTCDIRSM